MKREDLCGLEFDWFAVDRDDHIGVFSTAGYGEIPVAVLDGHIAPQDVNCETNLVKTMPVAGGWSPEGRGPGRCQEWKDLAARGVYVFDWRHWAGPYERIILPGTPVRLAAVPRESQDAFRLVGMRDLCFGEVVQIAVRGVACAGQGAAEQAHAADGRRDG